MRTVYIIADSRGSELEAALSPPEGYRFKVITKGGSTIQDLLKRTKDIINQRPCELVYILGGICSITQKVEGQVSLPFATTDEIYQTIKNLLKATITDLDKFDPTPVIICPLTGIDLFMANEDTAQARSKRKRAPRDPRQTVLDDAIIKLNAYIRILNSERGHRTPEIDSVVHRRHGADTQLQQT